MTYRGWYSKKDVLNDLRQVMGRHVLDLDEGSVVVGQQPPPKQINMLDKDAELQLLRLYGGCKASAAPIGKPDLAGITQMLRMVDDLTQEGPGREPTNIKSANTTISISKLNPNVPEFIPKSGTLIISPPKETKKVVTTNCDNVNLSEARIDRNQLTPDEIKLKKEMLKSKISETSKATCVKGKRERNLAMVTLLQMHCEPKVKDAEIPKLLSPAYFEKSFKNSTDEDVKDVSVNKPIKEEHLIKDSVEKYSKAEPVAVNIEGAQASDMAASVDKVQKWLYDTEKAKETKNENPKTKETKEKVFNAQLNGIRQSTGPQKSLYLGAVTFKRKASSKPMSPTSSDSNECVKTAKTVEFKPSNYATELTKTYIARRKLKESLKQDLWTKLEVQLKAKDEEILKKQAELNSESEGGDKQSNIEKNE